MPKYTCYYIQHLNCKKRKLDAKQRYKVSVAGCVECDTIKNSFLDGTVLVPKICLKKGKL